jgi:hypothetical protein
VVSCGDMRDAVMLSCSAAEHSRQHAYEAMMVGGGAQTLRAGWPAVAWCCLPAIVHSPLHTLLLQMTGRHTQEVPIPACLPTLTGPSTPYLSAELPQGQAKDAQHGGQAGIAQPSTSAAAAAAAATGVGTAAAGHHAAEASADACWHHPRHGRGPAPRGRGSPQGGGCAAAQPPQLGALQAGRRRLDGCPQAEAHEAAG